MSNLPAGHTSVVAAFIAAASGFGLIAAALIAILGSGIVLGKGLGAIRTIGVIASFLSIVFVSFAWNRVGRSLRRPAQTEPPLFEHPKAQLISPAMSFPVQPGSVTERTTDLLRAESDPAKTGEFLTERDEPVN